jgi:hypothetical protein
MSPAERENFRRQHKEVVSLLKQAVSNISTAWGIAFYTGNPELTSRIDLVAKYVSDLYQN